MLPVELEFLAGEFCTAFGDVFSQNTGAAYFLKPDETAAPEADGMGFNLIFSGTLKGDMLVWVDARSGAVLATRLLGETVTEDIQPLPEHEDAVTEIVNQVAGAMASSLRLRFGDAEINIERVQGGPPADKPSVVLRPSEFVEPVVLFLFPERALAESLQAAIAAPGGAVAPAPAWAKGAPTDKNLELIMDVELDLTLRFGRRTMPLSEVADLTTGSVIELDRIVDEPVELLLGERVIARGEVVIVDGNYGLRVTELSAPERAHSLIA